MTNTFINIANTVIASVLAYAMTPLILSRMGSDAYGIWVFLGIFSISGYFSLLDFGFQGAAIKYVAEFSAKNDLKGLQSIVSTTLLFFFIVGAASCLLLLLFNAFFFSSIFHFPENTLSTVKTLVNILALSFLFQFPALGFSALIEGMQRYDALRAVTILAAILSNVTIFFFLTSEIALPFMIGVSLATAFGITIAYGILAKKVLPQTRFTFQIIDRGAIRMLVRFSTKLFTSKMIGLVFNNTDKILIGVFLTVANQTDYDIVNKMHLVLLSILSIFNQAVLPAASQYDAQNNAKGLRLILLRSTKYASASVLPVFLLFFMSSDRLIGAWVGEQYQHLGGYVRLYISHILLTMFVGVSSTMLVGIDRVGKVLKISLWAAVLNLVISLATVRSFGIGGLIFGTVLANVITSLMYIIATNRMFQIHPREFFRETVLPLFPAATLTTIALVLTRSLLSSAGLWLWLLYLIGTMLFFFLVLFFTGVSSEEKRHAHEYGRKLKRVFIRPAATS